MKKSICFALVMGICAPLGAIAQASPSSSCPTVPGAYYQRANEWVSMDASHSMGFKTTNVAGAAFSYGLAKAKIKAQFHEARSPYQLNNSSLAVCLVGVTDSGRDITLAKFQEEKDRRELPMASYRMWTGVNAQLDPKVIVPIEVEKKGEKIYLVRSKEALEDGEFILFTIIPDVPSMVKTNTTTALGGYDIGFHAKPKN